MSIVLPLLGVGFVAQRIWSTGVKALAGNSIDQAIVAVLVGGIVYALDNLFLVLAWYRLLAWFGETNATWKISIAIYGSTQIARYIPGNIFHLPSRHLKGYQNGLKHIPLLGAAAYEIIGLLIAASLISLIGFLSGIKTAISLVSIVAVMSLALVSPVIIQLLIGRFKFARRFQLPSKTGLALLRGLLPIWSIYLLFFLLANSVFYFIVLRISGSGALNLVPVVFATFTLSWLAGFITPGAPAGIGVREGVMILILSKYIGEPSSILISLLARFVTLFGDLCFYFVGLWSARQIHTGSGRTKKDGDQKKIAAP